MYKQIKHDINSEINLFLYVREDNDAHMDIEIETTTGYITGGVTGKKSSIKEFNKICVMYSYIMVSCRTT